LRKIISASKNLDGMSPSIHPNSALCCEAQYLISGSFEF
jgi:hypothetical protein